MEHFKAIYKILSFLEKAIDIETPNWRELSPDGLGIPETRFTNIMRMLEESGYITGVQVKATSAGGHRAYIMDPALTLQGLEYLAGNENMNKARQSLQGVETA